MAIAILIRGLDLFRIFDIIWALTQGGPGIATTFPAIYVYDLMFQRGQIAEGAAAAIMILAAASASDGPSTTSTSSWSG